MGNVRDLVLEIKEQEDRTVHGGLVLLAPLVEQDYWIYRVALSPQQAILAFPKFFTIGVGFAIEEDWNTNLPYTCKAEQIYEHNKGDDSISGEDCLTAIRMIQTAISKIG
jgi:hypothetical protein